MDIVILVPLIYFAWVASQKVIEGLLRSKLGHWWENTHGIASEEDNVGGMSTHRWQMNILHEIQWEGSLRIRALFNVVEVNVSWIWVEYGILD